MAPARTIVVVGASLAGGTAAATLRAEGFDGRLVLVGDERAAPYERPPLSKRYLRGEVPVDELPIRPDGWWREQDVELRLGVRARALDGRARTVTLDDGAEIAFDRALVATGVRNRALPVPGAALAGVHQLRTVEDADRLRRAADSSGSAVVVGMGFVGAEVAASLRQLGLDVTVIEVFETALYRALGAQLGRVVEAIHRDRGVRFVFGETVERLEGGAHVERVVTSGGRTIEADLVIVGVGTEPNAAVLPDAAAPDGGIDVDETLATAVAGVFAAGDVASHRHPLFGRVRVEHFDNAIRMGVHAARGLLGRAAPFDDPHWFWSDQWEHELQMAGVEAVGRMIVRGSLEDRSFCAFFLDVDGALRSAVSLDWKRDVRRAMKLIRARAHPDPSELADPDVDPRSLLR